MPDTLLHFILRRAQHVDAPIITHQESTQFPPQQRTFLLNSGILKETSIATEIARPGRNGRGDPLVVRQTARGIFGVSEECENNNPVKLTLDDVRQYEISLHRLAEEMRPANRLLGVVQPVNTKIIHVGEKLLSNRQYVDIYLVRVGNSELDLMSICGEIRPAPPRGAIILLPCRLAISSGNLQLLRTWGIGLIAISDHLKNASWKLPLDVALRGMVTLVQKKMAASQTYCRIVANKGSRTLTERKEYEDFIRRFSGQYDMFVDGVSGEVLRWKDQTKRKRVGAKLTATEFSMLLEYVEAKKPLRPAATKIAANSSREAAHKLFETARRKVDLKIKRYKFYAFKMHKDFDRKLNAFEFCPPKKMSYCFIVPIVQ